jgi:hypothetical protein
MDPMTIVVIIFTGAFLGLCVWIERNSRKHQAGVNREEKVEATALVEELPTTREESGRKIRMR